MIDFSRIKKVDSKQMYKIYDQWPIIAKEAYNSKLKKVEFEKSEHIVFAGMGGSGALGDIFSAILSKTNIHVNVVKGYLLPKTVDSNSLVVVTSVSGNTEETISILKSAIDVKCKIIAFSDGGRIQEICKSNNIEHRKINMIHSPRASFTQFLFSMLNVLSPILPIADKDVEDSIIELNLLKNKIYSENLTQNNPALILANWLDEIPIIYYPFGLESAAIRFKNSLQENTKIHVISEDIIEACHNGIVAWDSCTKIKPILLRGSDDYIKTKQRWEIIKEYFKENKIEFKEINSINGSILSKLINLIYFLDYTSIYKSILLDIDPTPVKAIEYVKQKLCS